MGVRGSPLRVHRGTWLSLAGPCSLRYSAAVRAKQLESSVTGMSEVHPIVPVMEDIRTCGAEPMLTSDEPPRDRDTYGASAPTVGEILDALDATSYGGQVYEAAFRLRLRLPPRTGNTAQQDRTEQKREYQRALREQLTVTGSSLFTPIVPPIRYDDRARKARSEYGACPLCGLGKALVLDHCWDHGWCRGSVCSSCNRIMDEVDSGRRNTPRYREWRRRCVDCDAEMGGGRASRLTQVKILPSDYESASTILYRSLACIGC